jgi:iduronate 2-sulfatase
LYDHQADPREQNNLAEDAAHAERLAELSAQLRSAVETSYPESGEIPVIREGVWAPNLTDP